MIVAIAGRRIDAANAEEPRFPLAMVDSVKRRLINCFSTFKVTHVIGSGACGADLLAMEAAQDLEIPGTMVLPFEADTFKFTSVTDRPGNWGAIYDRISRELKKSNQLIELDFVPDDPEAYRRTNFHILDHALKIASQPGKNPSVVTPHELLALIVWEGQPKNVDDTTYHFMLEAQKTKFFLNANPDH